MTDNSDDATIGTAAIDTARGAFPRWVVYLAGNDPCAFNANRIDFDLGAGCDASDMRRLGHVSMTIDDGSLKSCDSLVPAHHDAASAGPYPRNQIPRSHVYRLLRTQQETSRCLTSIPRRAQTPTPHAQTLIAQTAVLTSTYRPHQFRVGRNRALALAYSSQWCSSLWPSSRLQYLQTATCSTPIQAPVRPGLPSKTMWPPQMPHQQPLIRHPRPRRLRMQHLPPQHRLLTQRQPCRRPHLPLTAPNPQRQTPLHQPRLRQPTLNRSAPTLSNFVGGHPRVSAFFACALLLQNHVNTGGNLVA